MYFWFCSAPSLCLSLSLPRTFIRLCSPPSARCKISSCAGHSSRGALQQTRRPVEVRLPPWQVLVAVPASWAPTRRGFGVPSLLLPFGRLFLAHLLVLVARLLLLLERLCALAQDLLLVGLPQIGLRGPKAHQSLQPLQVNLREALFCNLQCPDCMCHRCGDHPTARGESHKRVDNIYTQGMSQTPAWSGLVVSRFALSMFNPHLLLSLSCLAWYCHRSKEYMLTKLLVHKNISIELCEDLLPCLEQMWILMHGRKTF